MSFFSILYYMSSINLMFLDPSCFHPMSFGRRDHDLISSFQPRPLHAPSYLSTRQLTGIKCQHRAMRRYTSHGPTTDS